MFYDYDDCFREPSEFEEQIEEFKNSLKEAVRDEIKQKIENLEKELTELKEFRDERDKFIKEYKTKIREVEKEKNEAETNAKMSEEKWKKARLHQLLGDYITVGWRVGTTYEIGEKCDKCDKDRKIHFVSPQGKKYTEDCNCAKRHYKYFPQEAKLAKFYVRKKNYSNINNDKIDFYNRYYIVENDNEYDRYISSDKVYGSDFNFEDVNSYTAIFLNEEDCQRYCDWKNSKNDK